MKQFFLAGYEQEHQDECMHFANSGEIGLSKLRGEEQINKLSFEHS